jgi:hypothetical protein
VVEVVVRWPGHLCSSGRVVEVVVTWPGPDGPSALAWGGGKVVEVVMRRPRPFVFVWKGGKVVKVVARWAAW